MTWRWIAVALFIAAAVLLTGTARAHEEYEEPEVVAGTLAPADEPEPEPEPEAEPEPERPAVTSRGHRPDVARWTEMVSAYDWDVPTALSVIECESGGDPNAVNPYSGAEGLTQLYLWRWTARRLFGHDNLLDPAQNLEFAYFLWSDSGGTFDWHWYASIRCWGG